MIKQNKTAWECRKESLNKRSEKDQASALALCKMIKLTGSSDSASPDQKAPFFAV